MANIQGLLCGPITFFDQCFCQIRNQFPRPSLAASICLLHNYDKLKVVDVLIGFEMM